jgi:predicted transcriptional regulator
LSRHSLVHAFKLDKSGLARVFGELEAEVMEAVWDLGSPTVADVCERLGGTANYKTVMTVMNRLVEKESLIRRRDSRAFRYVAAEPRARFEERVSRQVAQGLLEEFGDLALAQFVDAVDSIDPDLLARLRALVAERTAAVDASRAGTRQSPDTRTDGRETDSRA